MASPSAAQRALAPLNTTLLPFLYQTRTILGQNSRRFPARTRAQIRRINVASKIANRRRPPPSSYRREESDSNSSHDVPFEGQQSTPFHKQRKSTITDSERQTFEKLFKQYSATKESKSIGLDNISEDLSGAAEDTLNAILDGAIAKLHPGSQVSASGMTPRTRRKLLRRQAMSAEERDAPLRKAQKEQFEHVEKLLREATSDVELWNVLENEVFSVIRRLNLDAPQFFAGQKDEATKKEEEKEEEKEEKKEEKEEEEGNPEEDSESFSEFQIIGPNYPSFMLIAMRQLRVDFPGSTLALALLPAIKSLGRGSYALGASTELYNELLAMAWLTYSDFQGIDDLLQEMENGGIDFDTNTLDLLDSIKKNALDAKSGRLGDGASAVLEMDRFKRGIRRLQRWRDEIRMRMETEAIRQAKGYEVQL